MPPLAGPGSRTRSFLRPSPGYKAHGHRLLTATVQPGDLCIEETSRESKTTKFYVCSCDAPLESDRSWLNAGNCQLDPKKRQHFTRNLFFDSKAVCGLYTDFSWSHRVKRFSSKVHQFDPQSQQKDIALHSQPLVVFIVPDLSVAIRSTSQADGSKWVTNGRSPWPGRIPVFVST